MHKQVLSHCLSSFVSSTQFLSICYLQLVLRFANRFFLPLWNRDNIDNVQVRILQCCQALIQDSDLTELRHQRYITIGKARLGTLGGVEIISCIYECLPVIMESLKYFGSKHGQWIFKQLKATILICIFFVYLADCLQGGFWN